ncbi:anti-anti-sigma factor [Nonomuraea wenchangensis]|uniref:Anti-sigma factor antagonist n=2 Tax=Nonomuraea wenchangensis TaxID=568860 RepID=A0A1I0KKT9_9ACTN|nr:anti-anti-sigma factor [Nonomuraea wenchangensis]
MPMTTDESTYELPGGGTPDWLTVRVEERDGHAVVRLDGELDLLTRPLLSAACDDLLSRGVRRIVIDATGLSFSDCAGLSALLGVRREAWRRGGSLVLTGVHGMPARLLAITGAAATLLPAETTGPAQAVGE